MQVIIKKENLELVLFKMAEERNIDKIKEKFSRIFKKGESRPRDPIKLDKIYETIRGSRNPLRISEISEMTKIKINSVKDYIKKYLEKKKYVKKDRLYTPPYLMIEHYKESPEFIYGKKKRDSRIEDEKDNLKSGSGILNKKDKNKVSFLIQTTEYNQKFFKLWNEIIQKLWRLNIYSMNKMKIGSGANRYKI